MLLGETLFLRGREIMVNFIMFDMLDFNIILDMDFLSHYGVEIECKKRKSNSSWKTVKNSYFVKFEY